MYIKYFFAVKGPFSALGHMQRQNKNMVKRIQNENSQSIFLHYRISLPISVDLKIDEFTHSLKQNTVLYFISILNCKKLSECFDFILSIACSSHTIPRNNHAYIHVCIFCSVDQQLIKIVASFLPRS